MKGEMETVPLLPPEEEQPQYQLAPPDTPERVEQMDAWLNRQAFRREEAILGWHMTDEQLGDRNPAELTIREQHAWERMRRLRRHLVGSGRVMSDEEAAALAEAGGVWSFPNLG